MNLLHRLQHADLAAPTVSQESIQERMARTDPDYARIRQTQHDVMQTITAQRLTDGLAVRREREFWARYGNGGQHP